MSSNRQQQVNSFLSGLTEKELDDYIDKSELNVNIAVKLKSIQEALPETHASKLTGQLWEKFNKEQSEYLNSIYKIGQAQVVAILLNEFYDADYEVSDARCFFKIWMDSDDELKNHVYEIMKDY